MLVQELRNKIKHLESQKTGAGTSSLLHVQLNGAGTDSVTSLINNQLPNQNLFALQEEYCTKLEKLVEQNASERTNLSNHNFNQQQKLESLQNQIKYMEDKELRLFS